MNLIKINGISKPFLTVKIAAALLLLSVNVTFGQDPFLPYLTGKPPVVTEDLGIEETPEGLKIHRMVFQSRVIKTLNGSHPSLVYVVIVHPAGPGPHPGMVRLHGGGGSADVPAAISSAKEGYISLVLDIPAIAGKGKSPKNSPDVLFGPKISASPDASHSGLFDAVLASVQSFYLLRSQPDVDKNNIAIAGASWGGYVATMLAGILDKDISGTYAAYGSGNFLKGAFEKTNIEKLPEKEKAEWLKYLDPGERAHNITKPYIIATASNDRHWSWMAVQATIAKMKGPVLQFYSPNDNHAMKYQGSSLMMPFFNHYLKAGLALPTVKSAKAQRLNDGSIKITYKVAAAVNLVASRIFYTSPGDNPDWTQRKWFSVEAKAIGKRYEAIIPAEHTSKPIDWYVLISDRRSKLDKDIVSASSLIQQLK